MNEKERSKRLLIVGIVGCLLYVIGDFLFAATGRGQTTENVGFMVRMAYLEMGTWRMVASILCGFVGTLLYYMGFHRMYGLLKIRVTEAGDRKWVKLFRVAYVTGTVAWAYVHAMFMTVALIFKYIYQSYGDMQNAADIANRVFYANAAPMVIAYLLCDVLLTVVMIFLVWKRIIREVLDVQPGFSQATGIVRNRWMAVLFAVLAWLVYVAALVCSHGSAFRTAADMRKTLMRHIARLPIDFVDEMGSGKVRRIVTEVTGSMETLLAHNLPDMAGAIATPLCMLVMQFLDDRRSGRCFIAPDFHGMALEEAVSFAEASSSRYRGTLS